MGGKHEEGRRYEGWRGTQAGEARVTDARGVRGGEEGRGGERADTGGKIGGGLHREGKETEGGRQGTATLRV